MGKRAMSLDNIIETSGMREMHSVHIHLGEEGSWSGNDWRDCDLPSLLELANVACPDVSSNVSANKWPPIMLGEDGIGHIEFLVSGVVVHGFHCSCSLSSVKYSLVCTLGVSFP